MVEKIRYNIISIKINVLHNETHEGFSRRNKITREKIRYNMISIKINFPGWNKGVKKYGNLNGNENENENVR